MPNRILKDSICTSPNIDTLSRDAEVFFYRLLVQCDDFGRMDARTPILRAKCYPLQIDRVTPDHIKAWLQELVQANLVTIYTVDGGDYLQMRTWERHQQIRAKRSKYPDMPSDDINCNQVQSDAPPIQSNPIQSESESESESKNESNRADGLTDKGEDAKEQTAPHVLPQPAPTTPQRTDTELTQAISAKLTDVGVGLSVYIVDTYVAAAQEFGIHAALGGIQAAADKQKQHTTSYVLACIRNKASGDNRKGGKPTNGYVTSEDQAKQQADLKAAKSRINTAQKLGMQPRASDVQMVERLGAAH
jgi:hypothetical protein